MEKNVITLNESKSLNGSHSGIEKTKVNNKSPSRKNRRSSSYSTSALVCIDEILTKVVGDQSPEDRTSLSLMGVFNIFTEKADQMGVNDLEATFDGIQMKKSSIPLIEIIIPGRAFFFGKLKFPEKKKKVKNPVYETILNSMEKVVKSRIIRLRDEKKSGHTQEMTDIENLLQRIDPPPKKKSSLFVRLLGLD